MEKLMDSNVEFLMPNCSDKRTNGQPMEISVYSDIKICTLDVDDKKAKSGDIYLYDYMRWREPFHYAVKTYNLDLIKLLCNNPKSAEYINIGMTLPPTRKGGVITPKKKLALTPLMLAMVADKEAEKDYGAKYTVEEHVNIIKALLEHPDIDVNKISPNNGQNVPEVL